MFVYKLDSFTMSLLNTRTHTHLYKMLLNNLYLVLYLQVDVLKVLSAEDTEKNHFVKWHEWFNYRGHTCLVFELLDMSLFDFMKRSQFSPMAVRNIRTILQQVIH